MRLTAGPTNITDGEFLTLGTLEWGNVAAPLCLDYSKELGLRVALTSTCCNMDPYEAKNGIVCGDCGEPFEWGGSIARTAEPYIVGGDQSFSEWFCAVTDENFYQVHLDCTVIEEQLLSALAWSKKYEKACNSYHGIYGSVEWLEVLHGVAPRLLSERDY